MALTNLFQDDLIQMSEKSTDVSVEQAPVEPEPGNIVTSTMPEQQKTGSEITGDVIKPETNPNFDAFEADRKAFLEKTGAFSEPEPAPVQEPVKAPEPAREPKPEEVEEKPVAAAKKPRAPKQAPATETPVASVDDVVIAKPEPSDKTGTAEVSGYKLKKVDISKLKIDEGVDIIALTNDINKALSNAAKSMEVFLPVSGYAAIMTHARQSDAANLFADYGAIESMRVMYQTLYDKITTCSFGKKPSFKEWLEMTSVLDSKLLFYGIYRSTFDTDAITVPCSNDMCDNVITADPFKDAVLDVDDKEKFKKQMKKFQSTYKSLIDTRANSTVLHHINDGVALSGSKIIVNFRNTSMAQHLTMLEDINKNMPDELTSGNETLDMLMYIERLLIPHTSESYVEVTDPCEIYKIIKKLTLVDTSELLKAIREHVQENSIEFSLTLKDPVCKSCGETIEVQKNIAVDTLFYNAVYKVVNG